METREHIADEVLLDYAEGQTDQDLTAQVLAHLETGCARCAAELDFWRRALAALRAGASSEPPEEVVQRAIAAYDERHGARRPVLERVIARLVFDSRVQPAMAGVRDAPGTFFQLLFQAGDTDIDLLCESSRTGWHVTGQALTAGSPEARWLVTAASARGTREAQADAQGEFRLTGLAPGVYEVILRAADREIVLPEVRLEGIGD